MNTNYNGWHTESGGPADLRKAPQDVASDSCAPIEGLHGFLVVNADDWGQDKLTTDKILSCCVAGGVTSVSAMVFMEDSSRAAELARENGIDVGLHLNLTSPFTATLHSSKLSEHLQQAAKFLTSNRFSRVVLHPGLMDTFNYLVLSQLDEFERNYGYAPAKIDGHHHMHLCENMMSQRLLPRGAVVRRNFSFRKGEKSSLNRLYRAAVDHRLASRYRLTDFLFNLNPMDNRQRLQDIYSLAKKFIVELETHPIRVEEFEYLSGAEFQRDAAGVRLASSSAAFQQHGAECGKHR